MKHYVVHLTPLRGLIASVRIAKFVGDTLGLDVVSTSEECVDAIKYWKDHPTSRGLLIVVNGPPAFCKFREELAILMSLCKEFVWAQNDFTIYQPSQTNRVARKRGWVDDKGHIRPPHTWGTIPDRATEYVNWNALTMGKPVLWRETKRRGLLYYGAYRGGRDERFKRYIPDKEWVTISAPTAARKKFALIKPNTWLVEPLDDVVEGLSQFQATVLIQDARSDSRFMSLPNRFYEALAAGVCQFLSTESLRTLSEAGYVIDKKWVIKDAADIDLSRAREYAAQQSADWSQKALGEKRRLKKQLLAAFMKISGRSR